MAETDRISEADRMELASLERAVSDAERMLLALPPGTRPLFSGFLHNAKARLGVLEKKIQDAEREQQEHARNEVALVALAQKEAALDQKEKETYGGFLREDFFTKRDFARLEDFYAHTWDRLSEGGKEQMSRRVWEGIRRDEYTFAELPKSVREKEAKQAYDLIRHPSAGIDAAAQIPKKDRDDFVRAYESEKREEAQKVLERNSFKNGLFLAPESKPFKSVQAETGRESEAKPMGREIAAGAGRGNSARPVENAGKAQDSLLDLKLEGFELAEVSAPPSAANAPRGEPGPSKSVPSLGRS